MKKIVHTWKIAILGLFAAVVISGCANESTNQPVEPDPEPTKTAVTKWKVVADGDNAGIAQLLGNAIFYDDNTWCILKSTATDMKAIVSITDSATNLSVTIDLSSMEMGEQTFKFTRI